MKGWLLLLLLALPAWGHQASTAFLRLDGNQGVLELSLMDLASRLNLDSDADGQLTWGEVTQHRAAVAAVVGQGLRFRRGEQPCALSLTGNWQAERHFNEVFLWLPLRLDCPEAGALALDYRLFTQTPGHKLLLAMAGHPAGMISPGQGEVALGQRPLWRVLAEYLLQGVWHIWTGIDHVLFLLALLLPAVLVARGRGWAVEANRKRVWRQVLWIVSAFTLAHSVTLTLTALGVELLPGPWVELAIAVSVLAAALNLIWPWCRQVLWMTAGFGLLHGMGFAGALAALGLPADARLPAILVFNLGVEVGQLAIVLLVLPPLLLFRFNPGYRRRFLPAAGSVMSLVAVVWTCQRLLVAIGH
ncbi:MAG: HupE/UreJ family protein [Pseudomonadota bacterium]|uniref:HupE/UreJ family protein n=1 Tax=Gallaecimonas pentaromativorans TaxID=584787 RepID=UPI00067F2336|nr:HupE/UreJ family protein [Gallaecimonas pentaromativorans]MED5524506.1 HupE/UreJ family protein [Pseudomonadota bacterium]